MIKCTVADLVRIFSLSGITIGACNCQDLSELKDKYIFDSTTVTWYLVTEFDVVNMLRVLSVDKYKYVMFASQLSCEDLVKFMNNSVRMNDSYRQMWNKDGNLVDEQVHVLFDEFSLYELVKGVLVPIITDGIVVNKLTVNLVSRMKNSLGLDKWDEVSRFLLKAGVVSRSSLKSGSNLKGVW